VLKRRNIVLILTALGTSVAAQNTAHDKAQKEKGVAAGEADAKRLLLLMDKDKNGKVSRKEFMSFMEAEFDRLDTNKDGELDVQELTKADIRARSAIHR
jgi:Ca2+-binding EF-hand superfamily protein